MLPSVHVHATRAINRYPAGGSGGGITTGAETVTVAVPKIEPSVALTLLLNTPVVFPAVNRPELELIVPGGLTVLHTGVIGTMLPLPSLPTAVNCCWPPMFSVSGFGVTVIVASAPATTVTLAVPEIEPEVARTLLLNVPSVLPAVNRPVFALMVPGGLV